MCAVVKSGNNPFARIVRPNSQSEPGDSGGRSQRSFAGLQGSDLFQRVRRLGPGGTSMSNAPKIESLSVDDLSGVSLSWGHPREVMAQLGRGNVKGNQPSLVQLKCKSCVSNWKRLFARSDTRISWLVGSSPLRCRRRQLFMVMSPALSGICPTGKLSGSLIVLLRSVKGKTSKISILFPRWPSFRLRRCWLFPSSTNATVQPTVRQFLFGCHLTLYVDRIDFEDAFRNPRFAVVLGRSPGPRPYSKVETMELLPRPIVDITRTLFCPPNSAVVLDGASRCSCLDLSARPPFREPTFDRYICCAIVFTTVRIYDDLGNRQLIRVSGDSTTSSCRSRYS